MRSEEIKIRLRFSSIINYLAIAYRTLIAVGFMVIIARRLSIPEFGLLGIILSFTSMIYVISRLWNYWVQRFISRNIPNSFGSGLLLTIFYGIIASLLYINVGFTLDNIINLKNALYFFVLSIPFLWLSLLNSFISSVAAITKPELIGIKGFIYETLRLTISIIFVLILGMRLVGTLISLELAMLISVSYVFYCIKKIGFLNLKYDLSIIKGWLKGFSVPIVDIVYSFLSSGVRFFASLISGSEVTSAYINVGYAAYSPIVSAATSSIPALYAKILRRSKRRDVEEVFKIFILINSLLLVIFIALSKVVASIYGLKYVNAWFIIVAFSLYAFFEGLRSILYIIVIGSSTVDVKGIRSIKEIIKSELFLAPLMKVAGISVSYIIGTILALTIFKNNYLMQALVFTLGLLLGVLLTLPWFIIRSLKQVKFNIPTRELFVGIISTSIIAVYIIYFRINNILIVSFWHDILRIFPHIVIILLIYFSTWYSLSSWFRDLAKASAKYLLRIMFAISE